MRLTTQHILTLVAMLVVMVAISVIYLALKAPVIDAHLGLQPVQQKAESPQEGVFVTRVPADSLNATVLTEGMQLLQLGKLAVRPQWLVEEPDQLPDWQQYNRLIDEFNMLVADAADGYIDALTDQGHIKLAVRSRTLFELPTLFWLQLMVGVLCFLIAAGVYVFRSSNPGARHFLFTGVGLLLSAPCAAVYSTRELMINGDLLRLLSAINWLGTLLFTVALVALFLTYPKQLAKKQGTVHKLTASSYLLAFIAWLLLVSNTAPEPGFLYMVIMPFFLLTFVLAFLQWKKTASLPLERAALKWYLLSIYLGTVLFTVFIILPLALGMAPLASQGLMFTTFLFMFIGIAFGITRYRLFDLDHWWLSAWRWFFAGMLLVALDALLVWGIGMGQEISLALALALLGWGWFPARQWLLQRLRSKRQEQGISGLVQQLFGAVSPAQLDEYWQRFLQQHWSVLEVETQPGCCDEPVIKDNGLTLCVPHLHGEQHLLLKQPQQGSRLFSRQDVMQAKGFFLLARQAHQGLIEREQAREERQRILDDLHDDLGSKLLSLVYEAESEQGSELAREALRDLREVVSQPVDGERLLNEAIKEWHQEAVERLRSADIQLDWQQQTDKQQRCPQYRLQHITRILREALNNIIRHAGATRVSASITQSGNLLELCIDDNGQAGDPDNWKHGRGLSTIRHRLDKLQGQGQWQVNTQGGCCLKMQVLLDTPSSSDR